MAAALDGGGGEEDRRDQRRQDHYQVERDVQPARRVRPPLPSPLSVPFAQPTVHDSAKVCAAQRAGSTPVARQKTYTKYQYVSSPRAAQLGAEAEGLALVVRRLRGEGEDVDQGERKVDRRQRDHLRHVVVQDAVHRRLQLEVGDDHEERAEQRRLPPDHAVDRARRARALRHVGAKASSNSASAAWHAKRTNTNPTKHLLAPVKLDPVVAHRPTRSGAAEGGGGDLVVDAQRPPRAPSPPPPAVCKS